MKFRFICLLLLAHIAASTKDIRVVISTKEMPKFFELLAQASLNENPQFCIRTTDPNYGKISAIFAQHGYLVSPSALGRDCYAFELNLATNPAEDFVKMWRKLSKLKLMELLVSVKYDDWIGSRLSRDKAISLDNLEEVINSCKPGECISCLDINLEDDEEDYASEDSSDDETNIPTVFINTLHIEECFEAAKALSERIPQKVLLCIPSEDCTGDINFGPGVVIDDAAYRGYRSFKVNLAIVSAETFANIWKELSCYGPTELWLSGKYRHPINLSEYSDVLDLIQLKDIIKYLAPGKRLGHFRIRLLEDYEASYPSTPTSYQPDLSELEGLEERFCMMIEFINGA